MYNFVVSQFSHVCYRGYAFDVVDSQLEDSHLGGQLWGGGGGSIEKQKLLFVACFFLDFEDWSILLVIEE